MSLAVALDIGSSSVAGAEVREQAGRVKLACAEVAQLPSGLVHDGEIVDPARLASELKRFWRSSGFSGRKVRLGVANQRVVVRTIEIPVIDDPAARQAAVSFEAAEQIPMPVDRSVVDFQSVDRVTTEAGEVERVVVVAAHRDMIDGLVSVARRAGLVPVGIDLESFALLRALLPPPGVLDEGSPDTPAQAVCHVGGEITNMIVGVDRRCHFTRLVGFGGSRLTAAVAERTGLDFPDAEVLKRGCGLLGDTPEGWDPNLVATARHALADASRPLANEIERSLEYYASHTGNRPVDRLILSGGTALCAGLDRYLSQALQLPVELGDPLRGMDATSPLSPDVAARAAVAVGLALDAPEAE